MIKLYSIILLFIGFVSSEVIPQNIEKIDLIASIENDSMFAVDSLTLNSNLSLNNFKYKYPGRAMLLSGVIPGLGELYAGRPLKALTFAGIEAGAWYFWDKKQNEMDIEEEAYKKYADEHWSFERWVRNYYDYYNYDHYRLYQEK